MTCLLDSEFYLISVFFFSESLKSNYNCGLYIFTLIYSVYPTLFIIFHEKKKGADIVGRIILNQFYCEYKCYQRNCASETCCLGAKKSFFWEVVWNGNNCKIMNLTEFFYPFNFLSAVIFYTVIFHRMVLTLFFTALIWVGEMFSICFAITFVWGFLWQWVILGWVVV